MPVDRIALRPEEYQEGWRKAYERESGPVWQEDPIPIVYPAISSLLARGKEHVLEPGCGDGRNTHSLVQAGLSVVGMDLSSLALQRVADRAITSWDRMPTLVKGDIERLPEPFPERIFDAVLCFDVFGQLAQVDQAIDGLRSVLAPDGMFVANLYTPEDVAFGEGEQVGSRSFLYDGTLFRFFDRDDVDGLFEGFTVEKVDHMRWDDPPHPGYREYPHTHDNLIVWARRR